MNPRKRECLKLVQHNLRASKTKSYLGLLAHVLTIHQCERTKELSRLLRERKFLELYALADSLASQQYEDPDEHFRVNQIVLLIKKYPWPSDLLDLKPEERAIESFKSSEKRMRLINRKFQLLSSFPERDKFRKERAAARYWVRSIIGSYPNYRRVFDSADFGPGASVGVGGDATSFSRKQFSETWTVTPGAFHHGFAAVMANHQLLELLFEKRGNYYCYDLDHAFSVYKSKVRVVEHNNISFVPKTAKTDRTIAVEPLLNGFVQKGIDQVLRKKLLVFGIDLSVQENNQEFARLGSLDDSDDGFVTIDMKSASDSVSRELVRYLLPPDWYSLLDRTRSKRYMLRGDLFDYHKFCSMGNGFCFPLETLLFVAACKAVGCGRPSVDFLVYGDDIIVRKRYASSVLSLLRHWGFRTNSDKTFLEGPFRESCGRDWFGGQDVRPFTLDYELDSLQSVFKFMNLTQRNDRTSRFFRPLREYVVRRVPIDFRFYRPFPGEVDSGIDSTGDEFLQVPSCRFKNGKWYWLELASDPRVDYDFLEKSHDKRSLIGEALRGSASIACGRFVGSPKVTLRNRPQMKVVRKGYVSTSNWLPTPK